MPAVLIVKPQVLVYFEVFLKSTLPKCSKDSMNFLISSFKDLTFGANKARLKFKFREEGENVLVLLNRKVLEEIMQGKFSIYFGKIIFFKWYFIIQILEGIFV